MQRELGLVDPEIENPLVRAWIEMLGRYPFDWFFTGTFRDHVHPEAAEKRYRRFINDLNRSLYGRHWMKKPGCGVYWIVAWERQQRNVLHLHALIGDNEDLNNRARRLIWMDYWNRLAGFARIEPIADSQATIRYVCKYVAKGGEIDLSPNLGMYAKQLKAPRMR